MKITYSINQYDSDGDIFDECILLHLHDGRHIVRLRDLTELDGMINQLLIVKEQIKEERP